MPNIKSCSVFLHLFQFIITGYGTEMFDIWIQPNFRPIRLQKMGYTEKETSKIQTLWLTIEME